MNNKTTQVNGDVVEVVSTIQYILDTLANIWESIPIEVKMYIGVMYATSAVLQTYKVWRLSRDTKKVRVAKMRRASTVFAVLMSGIAFGIYHSLMHFGWFIFSALTAAKSVMYMHYVMIDVISPILKSVKNAVVDRLYMMIAGKPRGDKNA